jgi:hypothetical protein
MIRGDAHIPIRMIIIPVIERNKKEEYTIEAALLLSSWSRYCEKTGTKETFKISSENIFRTVSNGLKAIKNTSLRILAPKNECNQSVPYQYYSDHSENTAEKG